MLDQLHQRRLAAQRLNGGDLSFCQDIQPPERQRLRRQAIPQPVSALGQLRVQQRQLGGVCAQAGGGPPRANDRKASAAAPSPAQSRVV